MNTQARKNGIADSRLTTNEPCFDTDCTISGRNSVTPMVPKACSNQNRLSNHTWRLRKATCQASL
ncbi:hypothetical protein D3C87_1616600 [compost metagenome]